MELLLFRETGYYVYMSDSGPNRFTKSRLLSVVVQSFPRSQVCVKILDNLGTTQLLWRTTLRFKGNI